MRGNALLAITLRRRRPRVPGRDRVRGWANTDPAAPRESIEAAAGQAIASFLNDVTPMPVTTRVRLDDEDPGQQAFLDAAKAGATAQAAHDLELYFQQNPNIPSAAYNLAVLKEAMGDFHGALELYDRALALGGKDYYSRARAGCAQRVSAAESLSAATPH
jgi:tetratricopeptide (TPR) repeat protein